jgi:hypothetical protein
MTRSCRCPCHGLKGRDACRDAGCPCPCHQFSEWDELELRWVHTGIDRTAPGGPRVTFLRYGRP